MTTIAANREMMAADSQATRSQVGLIVSMSDIKLRRINGDIVGCQGRDDEITEFEAWYAGEGEKPENLEEYFAALILTSEGRLFKYYDRLTPVEMSADFMAMGSGEEIAMGAMAAGATPEEAVEIACRLNIHTGPPVVVEKLKEE